MITFNDVYQFVTQNNNFGINPYEGGETDIYISNGIKYALDKGLLKPDELSEAIKQFKNKKYGLAYDYDETPINGHEYGEYKTTIEADGETAFIWTHREKHPQGLNKDYFVCYFHFEY